MPGTRSRISLGLVALVCLLSLGTPAVEAHTVYENPWIYNEGTLCIRNLSQLAHGGKLTAKTTSMQDFVAGPIQIPCSLEYHRPAGWIATQWYLYVEVPGQGFALCYLQGWVYKPDSGYILELTYPTSILWPLCGYGRNYGLHSGSGVYHNDAWRGTTAANWSGQHYYPS